MNLSDWKSRLQDQNQNQILSRLYGPNHLVPAQQRCLSLIESFAHSFGYAPDYLFSAPGRTELGGNHTDHQHGRVLAASVDLDILSAVSPNHEYIVRVQSEGYPMIEVDLRELSPVSGEENSSPALIRGIAARMTEQGHRLRGLDAYLVSNVPGGSGLSSSAAFEVLIGTIFNALYCDNAYRPIEIAQIGQYAENVFFGKPCGLMDQMASSVGGVVAIDFANTEHPIVDSIQLNLAAEGYALCILDSGADHADLTGEYAAITEELWTVSRTFGKNFLRDVPEQDFFAALRSLRQKAGDRAVLRAMHFYTEDQRAAQEAQALQNHDFSEFLRLVQDSGRSSALYLQNVTPTGAISHQDLLLTVALSEYILNGKGAARVHGGGFAGTAQAFVPLDMLSTFQTRFEAVFGAGSCHIVTIRPVGGVQVF